jgi:hypothetical protein
VRACYDFSARGWYAEARLRHEVPVGRVRAWVGGEAGASHGQSAHAEYYAADGFTHAGASAGLTWVAGYVTFVPELRWTCVVDGATLPVAGRTDRRSKAVFGMAMTRAPGAR